MALPQPSRRNIMLHYGFLALALMVFLMLPNASAYTLPYADYNSNTKTYALYDYFILDKIAEVQMIENTDTCLTLPECHSTFRIRADNPDLQKIINVEFIDKFSKESSIDYDILYKKIDYYDKKVNDYEKCTEKIIVDNKTGETKDVETDCFKGYHIEQGINESWVAYEGLDKYDMGKDIYIKIQGKGGFNKGVDMIPTIFDYKLSAFVWWNSTFDNCISFNRTNIYVVDNFPMYKEFYSSDSTNINTTSWGNTRFVNASCGNGGTELTYEIDSSNSSTAGFWIRTNTIAGVQQFGMYIGPKSLASASNGPGVWSDAQAVYHFSNNNTAYDSKGTFNASSSGTTLLNTTAVFGKGVSMSAAYFITAAPIYDGAYTNFTGMFFGSSMSSATAYTVANQRDELEITFNARSGNFTIGDWYNTAGSPFRVSFTYSTPASIHQYAWRFETSGNTQGYLDGLNVANTTGATGTYGYTSTYNTNFGRVWEGSNPFLGLYDELRFYKDNLNPLSGTYLYEDSQNMNSTIYKTGLEQSNKGSLTVALSSPADNYNSTTKTIFFNATITPATSPVTTLKNATLYIWNGGTATHINYNESTAAIILNWSKTLLDANYTWNVYAQGVDSNSNYLTAWGTNRTLIIDSQAPNISIIYPAAGNKNSNISDFNYTYMDARPDSCWYSRDAGATNSTTDTAGTNFTNVTSVEGNNTWTLFCNDTFNNLNSTSVTFFRDTIYPLINWYATSGTLNPTGVLSSASFSLQSNATDANLVNTTLYLYNSAVSNINKTVCASSPANCTESFTGMANGLYYYNATACDLVNNCNTTAIRNFTLDTVAPSISIVLPAKGTTFNLPPGTFELNYTIVDPNIQACWYSYNGGANTSVTCGDNASISFTRTGMNNLTAYVNDSGGNKNFSTTYFYAVPLMGSCNDTLSLSFPFLNWTIKNETNYAYLNETTQDFTFSYYVLNQTFNNTINGTHASGAEFNFLYCIYPNFTTMTITEGITITKRSLSDNREYWIQNITITNSTSQYATYLLTSAESTLNVLKVQDEYQTAVADAYVTVQKWDVPTDSFITLQVVKTDNSGEALLNLDWYDIFYRFIVVLDGTTRLITTQSTIAAEDITLSISSTPTFVHDKFYNTDYQFGYNNNTRVFSVLFNVPSGQTTSNCLRLSKLTLQNYTTICDNCSSASTATLTCGIGTNGEGQYTAVFYGLGSNWYYEALTIFYSTAARVIDHASGTIMALILAVTVSFMFLISPAIAITMFIAGLLVSVAIGLRSFDYAVMIGIIIICGLFIWRLKR